MQIICFLYPCYHTKILGDILKNVQKTVESDVTKLMLMRMRLKMNLGLDMGTDILKYKMYLSIMMVLCIKQHQTKIWSSVHEKVKQRWGWVEKKDCSLQYFTFALGTIWKFSVWNLTNYNNKSSLGFEMSIFINHMIFSNYSEYDP